MEYLRDLVAHSIEVTKREQAPSGAYPACSTFPVYGYAWFRDGGFVADGLRAHGILDGPRAFHDWAARVVTDRADRIEEIVVADGQVEQSLYLPTRYTLDGADDNTQGWWDFQLDGYGIWLWALERFLAGTPDPRYATAVNLTVRYLCATWQQPCYDWWEEHNDHVHVATLAAIQAGLRAAVRTELLDTDVARLATKSATVVAETIAGPGSVAGRLRKWLGSDATDASLLAAVAPLAVTNRDTGARTVAAVEQDLLDHDGMHRFRADVFYGGGRWPVLAGFLGQAYQRYGRTEDAMRELRWIAGTADANGDLPEQVSDRLLAPEHEQAWIDRWGPVARPLLWSHGAYLSLAADLGVTA